MKNPIPVELRARLSKSFSELAHAINVPEADYFALWQNVVKDLENIRVFIHSSIIFDALSKTSEDSEPSV